MQKLTDNAVRARELLTRENAPLPPACARVLTADLARVLGEYFSNRYTYSAPPEVSIERGTELRITVRARAAHAKPFGVL